MEDGVTSVEFEVRYAETDQMGIVYHSHYLVWCDVARTDLLKKRGWNYADLERGGLKLAVIEASVRYMSSAVYGDLIRVKCWPREVTRRTVEFGYLIERAEDGKRLATARTTLIALNSENSLSKLLQELREKLAVVKDPVRV
jgi:acyl-CoA thioester hydrolase